jgi:hypothetical protein
MRWARSIPGDTPGSSTIHTGGVWSHHSRLAIRPAIVRIDMTGPLRESTTLAGDIWNVQSGPGFALQLRDETRRRAFSILETPNP